MDVKDILKKEGPGVGAFLVGVACGHGVIRLYERWRDKRTIIVPAEEPKPVTWERNAYTVIGEPATLIDTIAHVPLESVVYLREAGEAVAEVELFGDKPINMVIVGDTEPVVTNVFTRRDGDVWDYEAELAERHSKTPYILHQEEFVENETGFRQLTVEYYEGDDIVAEGQVPIYNHAGILGELKFGHGTSDPNAVYIRNETLMLEWEVLRHTGSFEIEVLGYEADAAEESELRHSAPLRFRRD